jgi:hypothetical protein
MVKIAERYSVLMSSSQEISMRLTGEVMEVALSCTEHTGSADHTPGERCAMVAAVQCPQRCAFM